MLYNGAMSPKKRVQQYDAQFTLLVTMGMWLDVEGLQRVLQMGGKSQLIRKILSTAISQIMEDLSEDDRETFRKVRESLQLTQHLESGGE